jgi:hypothetical protein
MNPGKKGELFTVTPSFADKSLSGFYPEINAISTPLSAVNLHPDNQRHQTSPADCLPFFAMNANVYAIPRIPS